MIIRVIPVRTFTKGIRLPDLLIIHPLKAFVSFIVIRVFISCPAIVSLDTTWPIPPILRHIHSFNLKQI
jgi:hypothetical protein